MLFKSSLALAAVGLALLGFAKAENNTLADVLLSNGQTNIFYSKINGTSAFALLQGNGTNATYTVFAPSDSAFTPEVNGLLPSIGDLNDLLRYHIVNGTHPSSSFQTGANIIDSIVNGNLLKWSNGTGLALCVNKNPSSAQVGSGSTPTAGLVAFYGVGAANVTQTDIQASNGVIHIIDVLMSLPQSPVVTVQQSAIVSRSLTAFNEAINQTGLASTINGGNGVTIFAPSDSAFAKADLGGLSNDTLTKILKYHIVNQVFYSTNISSFPGPTNVTTAEGDNVTITPSNGGFTVGNYNTTGKVVLEDIVTDNGVIHIIDMVLFPINVTNSSNSSSTANTASTSLTTFIPIMFLSIVVIFASSLL